MATQAVPFDALLPRPPEGLARGAGLSLLVHAGLIAALTLGVGWHMRAPEVVSAELWSSVPQVAAPKLEEAPAPTPAPPPPPPAPVVKDTSPPPNEAQIATERAERKKRDEAEQREKAEQQKKREADEKKQRDLEDRKKQQEAQKADQAKLDKLRAEQMKRMLGTLQGNGSPTSAGTAARDAGPSAGYAAKLVARIKSNLIFADTLPGNPAAEVEVRSTPTGTIMARQLIRSSGSKDYDEAVLRAIDRTNTLPPDTDGRVPSTIIITFRPNE